VARAEINKRKEKANGSSLVLPLVKLNGNDFIPQNNTAFRALAMMLKMYDTTSPEDAYAADVILSHTKDIV
jgi:hypothetical protein